MKRSSPRLTDKLSSWPGYDALRFYYHKIGLGDGGRTASLLRAWYAPFVTRKSLVFDVGANRGDHTNAFLSLGASVVAVEPNSQCCAALRGRFAFRRVKVERCAVGSRPGEAELRIGRNDTLSSLSEEWMDRRTAKGRFSSEDESRLEKVRVRTLDELVAQYGEPDFIKIDVEGFEHEALLGLSRRPPAACFEFNSEAIDIAKASSLRLAEMGAEKFCIRMGRGDTGGPLEWMNRDHLFETLHRFEDDSRPLFGDIFVQ